jgi:hypothetical protein
MSYPHWEPDLRNHFDPPHAELNGGGAVGERLPLALSADTTIDAALRSLPLPDGLLTRLDQFVHAMTDDAADSVDFLGC